MMSSDGFPKTLYCEKKIKKLLTCDQNQFAPMLFNGNGVQKMKNTVQQDHFKPNIGEEDYSPHLTSCFRDRICFP